MVGSNSGVSSLIPSNAKSAMNHNLIIRRYLLHQENLSSKSLKMNIVTVVSKLFKLVTSK